MNKILLLVIAAVIPVCILVFGLGYQVGSRPTTCNLINHKIEAAQAFCQTMVSDVITKACDEIEASQQPVCVQVMTLQAGMACETMTHQYELADLKKKAGC
jgi:hypothetical protein